MPNSWWLASGSRPGLDWPRLPASPSMVDEISPSACRTSSPPVTSGGRIRVEHWVMASARVSSPLATDGPLPELYCGAVFWTKHASGGRDGGARHGCLDEERAWEIARRPAQRRLTLLPKDRCRERSLGCCWQCGNRPCRRTFDVTRKRLSSIGRKFSNDFSRTRVRAHARSQGRQGPYSGGA